MSQRSEKPITEFQRILEEKIAGPKSSSSEEASARNSQVRPQSFTSDFLLHFFSGRTTASQPKFSYQDVSKGTERPTSKDADGIGPQIKIEVVKKSVPPRQKRKLSFDQRKALKIFVKFGEIKIDDWSTDDEIKTAYRKLAKKFHPDVAGVKAGESFRLISNAYRKLIS